VLDPFEPHHVGPERRIVERMRRERGQPAGDEREERREHDDDRRRDQPPPPEAPGGPDEECDRGHREDRLRPKRRPLGGEPAQHIERPETPVVLPPQVDEAEREADEPQGDEQHHPGDDAARDPAESH
jgi:hypothetical protein